MDAITALLASLGGGESAGAALLGSAFLLTVFAAAALGITGLVAARGTRRRRFTPSASGQAAAGGGAGVRYQDPMGASPVMQRLSRHFTPEDERTRSQMRRDLARAGFRHPNAVSIYASFRILLAVALPGLALPMVPLLSRDMGPLPIVLGAVCLGLLGYLLPTLAVTSRARQRQRQIRDGFPEALDLMVVCVEAGLGLDEAIVRVAREMEGSNVAVAEELVLTSLELRAGRGREDALRNLAERSGVDEVAAFATLLIQSDELGTSIADALRVYADDMRSRRLLRAEEKAQRLPVLMALPLAFCLLPSFMLVIMMPVLLRIVRVLLPAGVGG